MSGYSVYRDGAKIATLGAATLRYQDTGAAPSTTYTYTVDAFDAAGNRSARSSAATATTPAAPPAATRFTFGPGADAYVQESLPSTNSGARTSLRVDGSPIVRSYLRFSVSGVGGTISRATLRLTRSAPPVAVRGARRDRHELGRIDERRNEWWERCARLAGV